MRLNKKTAKSVLRHPSLITSSSTSRRSSAVALGLPNLGWNRIYICRELSKHLNLYLYGAAPTGPMLGVEYEKKISDLFVRTFCTSSVSGACLRQEAR